MASDPKSSGKTAAPSKAVNTSKSATSGSGASAANQSGHSPISVTLENGPEKLQGFIMKLTAIGIMVELDKISFKVGSYVTAQFDLGEGVISERVRSIKHYKDFYRTRPKSKQNEPPPAPKMLCELHFFKPLETTRVAITKFLLKNRTQVPIKK